VRELDVIERLSRKGGQMLKAEVARPGGPRGHGYKAPVDDEIEAMFLAELLSEFPDDTVISEETGGRAGTSGRAFVLDPHDGTRDFLMGRTQTSVSVALVEDGAFLAAVVYVPRSGDLSGPDGVMVSWARGGPLRVDGQPFVPSPSTGPLSKEHKVLISPNVRGHNLKLNHDKLAPAEVVGCPSVATRMAMVAIGRAEAAFTILNPLSDWDFAAGQALLQAVGGDIVGPDGSPVQWKGIRSHPPALNGYFGARRVALATDVAARFKDITGG
jgi:ADP-ribosyl-[dinitrogen reductase] hydrolase